MHIVFFEYQKQALFNMTVFLMVDPRCHMDTCFRKGKGKEGQGRKESRKEREGRTKKGGKQGKEAGQEGRQAGREAGRKEKTNCKGRKVEEGRK
jgi:hypothetical protein